MEKPSSLKKTIEAEIASSMKTKNFILRIPFFIIFLLIIIKSLAKPEFFSRSHNLNDLDFLAIVIPLIVLIILLVTLETILERKIIKKANKVAFKFIRAKIIALLANYLGEDRIKDHKRPLAQIISDVRELQLCNLRGERNNLIARIAFGKTEIEIYSEIEFAPLEHIFKQNGKAIIVDGLRINEEGDVIMNYYKNDSPGVFKMHQFPAPAS